MLFYFDINDGEDLPDQQGLELPDLEAAQAYAAEMAMSFLRQPAAQLWRYHRWKIDICNASRAVLYSIRFEMSHPQQH